MRVWDVQRRRWWRFFGGVKVACLRGHKQPVTNVTFSHGGRRILSGSLWNKTVRVWDAESGECLEVIQGTGDVAAIAAGDPHFPRQATKRSQETVVEPAGGGAPIAWFPVAIEHITTHPYGRTWAGSVGNYLCLFTLENARPAPSG